MNTPALAVTFVVPLTAVAVKLADGLVVERENAVLGGVNVNLVAVHCELLAPRVILNGKKFSLQIIKVSALCVK